MFFLLQYSQLLIPYRALPALAHLCGIKMLADFFVILPVLPNFTAFPLRLFMEYFYFIVLLLLRLQQIHIGTIKIELNCLGSLRVEWREVLLAENWTQWEH